MSSDYIHFSSTKFIQHFLSIYPLILTQKCIYLPKSLTIQFYLPSGLKLLIQEKTNIGHWNNDFKGHKRVRSQCAIVRV